MVSWVSQIIDTESDRFSIAKLEIIVVLVAALEVWISTKESVSMVWERSRARDRPWAMSQATAAAGIPTTAAFVDNISIISKALAVSVLEPLTVMHAVQYIPKASKLTVLGELKVTHVLKHVTHALMLTFLDSLPLMAVLEYVPYASQLLTDSCQSMHEAHAEWLGTSDANAMPSGVSSRVMSVLAEVLMSRIVAASHIERETVLDAWELCLGETV